jgi:hypothetical protein
MVISAYQPVERNGKEGTNSVASQHRSLLLQSGDTTDNPRTAFRRDLLQQLNAYQNDGSEFIIVGDFNEAYTSDPDGMSHIAGSFGLVNLMSHRHPNTNAPVTYARGVKGLDYALGTPKVAEAVVAAGYEAFNERFTSDHRGYFFDFDTQLLFGSPTQDLATPHQKRRLCTSHLKNTTVYIEKVYELLEAHNVIERVECLTLVGDRHTKAEAIDRDVTAACLAAESRLPEYDEAAWSGEPATARKRTHAIIIFQHESRPRNSETHR